MRSNDQNRSRRRVHTSAKEAFRYSDNSENVLALAFDQQRPRLLRVAYSITGSVAEAEDCIQEAWLRLQRLDNISAIRDLSAWLTTTVARLALDALGSARSRREQYVGTWLPEPLVSDEAYNDPAEQVTLEESVSMALLIVLERLSAAERTAFLLHDVFGLPFEEIANIIGRSPAAVRQLASRARRHVENGRPRFTPTRAEQHKLVSAFVAACQAGDLDQLVAILSPDVVWRGDGGGKVSSNIRVVQGATRVARGIMGVAQQTFSAMRIVDVNGAPGLVLVEPDGTISVVSITVDHNQIAAIDVIRNPDKLTAVRLPE